MQLKTVVLPAPLGPIRLTISPAAISKLTESTATRPPKRQVSSRTLSRSWAGAGCAPLVSGAVLTRASGGRSEHLGIGWLLELELAPSSRKDALGTEAHHQNHRQPED